MAMRVNNKLGTKAPIKGETWKTWLMVPKMRFKMWKLNPNKAPIINLAPMLEERKGPKMKGMAKNIITHVV